MTFDPISVLDGNTEPNAFDPFYPFTDKKAFNGTSTTTVFMDFNPYQTGYFRTGSIVKGYQKIHFYFFVFISYYPLESDLFLNFLCI